MVKFNGHLQNIFLQVDKEYYRSCQENGEYCRFHQNVMNFTRNLRSNEWFTDYQNDIDHHEDHNVLKFQSLSNIILKILNDNISNLLTSDESCITNVDILLQKLEAFDYVDYKDSLFLDLSRKNGLYNLVFEKIERLLKSIGNIFERVDYDEYGDDHYDCCIHHDGLASALGELKDGPVYSLPKIQAADLLIESELVMMEHLLNQCNVFSCGLFQREIDTTERLINELHEYIEIKHYNDDMDDRIDTSCSFFKLTKEQCEKKFSFFILV